MIHELKCWPEPFEALWSGRKLFDFRRDDRDFKVGDTLRQSKWDPMEEDFMGRTVYAIVTYIIRGPKFGIPDGYCVMSLSPNTFNLEEESHCLHAG